MVVPGRLQPLPVDLCLTAGTAVCVVYPHGGSPSGICDGAGRDPGTLSRSCHHARRWLWKSSPPDLVKIEVPVCKALVILQVFEGVLT